MSAAATGPLPPRRLISRAGASALGLVVLTGAHHAYGAAIYDARFRAHVVAVAVPVGLVIGGLLLLAGRSPIPVRARWAARGAVVVILALAALIGGYEGGYNHLLKNLLYAAPGGHDLWLRLFPPPLYEPPGDPIFEVSGVAQLVVGLIAARDAWRLWRSLAARP
jgi:hypothetical protein